MTSRAAGGQSLAEFALVLPVVLLLFMALFDMGRAVYAYNTVSNAARSALRVAVVDQDLGVIEAKAREQAMALDQGAVTVTVDVADPNPDCAVLKIGCMASVAVDYDFVPLTPIIGSIVGPIGLGAAAEMPIENVNDSVP